MSSSARRRSTFTARSRSESSRTRTSREYRDPYPRAAPLLTSCPCPLRSTKCPHAFSGDAIKEIIQRENGQTPCPVAGCSARLTLSSVEPDENLARRVAAHVKRLREGRTQTSTQAKTYARMELSEDEEGDGEEDEDEETVAARKVKKEVKKEKVARGR